MVLSSPERFGHFKLNNDHVNWIQHQRRRLFHVFTTIRLWQIMMPLGCGQFVPRGMVGRIYEIMLLSFDSCIISIQLVKMELDSTEAGTTEDKNSIILKHGTRVIWKLCSMAS